MMENDDRLIGAFFASQKQEIADNGFSRRVMHRLPGRHRRLSQWWSACGFALAALLFIALDGLRLVADALLQALGSMWEHGAADVDLRSLAIAGVVLLALAYKKIASLA